MTFIYSLVFASDIKDKDIDLQSRNKNLSPDVLHKIEQIKLLIVKADLLKHNNPDSAIHYYSSALPIAVGIKDYKNEATLYGKIGAANYIKGEYDYALENFIIALNIWRTLKSKKGIATGLNTVGLIYNMLHMQDEALEYHKNSVLLCKELSDSALLAVNYFNIGLLYESSGEHDSALYYAKYAYKLNLIANDTEELIKINNLVGYIYVGKKDFNLAREEFLKVIDNNNLKNKWEMSYALAGLALIEQTEGNFNKSIEYGSNSYQLAKKINAKWDIQNVTKLLSESYASIGDYKNAYVFYKEYKLYSDSVFNEQKEKRINYLQLKQKDFEYIVLSQKNEVQKERIIKKNSQIIFTGVGFLFVVLLAIILYRISYIKTKLNNKLKTKNFEIDRKNKELTKLNSAKDTFFRIIGHDLKGPMSTVVSFTDMLLNNYDQFTKEEIIEYIGFSKTSAQNAIEILENLLDWVKTQARTITVNPTETNIYNLISNIVDNLQANLFSKNINLSINIDSKLVASLDQNMTFVIIRNILTNAIKFTNNNGEINIEAKKINSKVLITISDNGIGMDEEKLNGLFDIKDAKSSPGTNMEKGIGIGLILCKELTESQGGTIWAESIPQQGSSFFIKI